MRRESFSSVIPACVVLVVAGCSTTKYRYVPTEHQVESDNEKGAALYNEPASSPSGKVRVISMGVTDVKPKEDADSLPSLHLRMAISNQSKDQVWRVNAQDQIVSFPDRGQARPVAVKSEATSMPALEIRPGELRTVDLYFELPEKQKKVEDLPVFDFTWQVQAGERLVKQTTPFDRQIIPRMQTGASYPFSLGVGAAWGPGYFWR